MFGAREAESGTLRLGSKTFRIAGLSPQRSVRERIALVPADRQLLGLSEQLALWENIVMLVEDEHYRGGVFHRNELVALAREAIARFEIRPPLAHAVTSTFSGGNQQKALLAKWLIARPRLLLLHEPTQGVDVGARRDIYRFVKSAATLDQTAVLWVTTDFGELAEVCDRVIVLSQGRHGRHADRRRTKRRRNHRSRAAADQGGQMSAPPGAPAPVETGGRDERPAERTGPRRSGAWGSSATRSHRVRRHGRRVRGGHTRHFSSIGNLSNILGGQAVLFILVMAVMLPTIMGDFVDLSLGSSLGLSAMTLAVLNVQHGTNIVLACVAGVGAAVVVGLVNVFFVVFFDNDPFIVTLGTMTIVQGVIYIISGNNNVGIVSGSLTNWIFNNSFLSIPLEFYYGLAIFVVVWYVLSFTPVGQKALGDRAVARRGAADRRAGGPACGPGPSPRGGYRRIAGIAYAATNGTVDLMAGSSPILPAYAAVFLGRPRSSRAAQRSRLSDRVYFLATGTAGLSCWARRATTSKSSTGPRWSRRSRSRRRPATASSSGGGPPDGRPRGPVRRARPGCAGHRGRVRARLRVRVDPRGPWRDRDRGGLERRAAGEGIGAAVLPRPRRPASLLDVTDAPAVCACVDSIVAE